MDDIQQATTSVAVDTRSIVAKKGDKGAKLAQLEQNKHVIQNALILLFCLILFIGSFFIGVNFEYEYYAYNNLPHLYEDTCKQTPLFTVKLNTIQFIEGTLACMDSSEKARIYMSENNISEDFYAIIADCLLTDDEKADLKEYEIWMAAESKLIQLKNDEEVCTVIGDKLSQSKINYLKVFIYASMISNGQLSSQELTIGYYLGFFVLALELCVMITSLVFSIMALVALIKGTQLQKPLLCLLLPFIFILILVVLLSVNEAYAITDVFAAMIALSVLSVILLAVHKILFEQPAEMFKTRSIAKKITLTAIGLIACFVALAPLFTYTFNGLGVNYAWTISGHNLLRFLSASSYTKFFADTSIFILMVNLFYIGALTSLITVVLSVCTRLHNDKPNALLVRTIMSMVMSVITILFIIVIHGRYGDMRYSNVYFKADVNIGVGLIISVAMCIALIVVDNAWKTEPKTALPSGNEDAFVDATINNQ